jgi:hypothetical protein
MAHNYPCLILSVTTSNTISEGNEPHATHRSVNVLVVNCKYVLAGIMSIITGFLDVVHRPVAAHKIRSLFIRSKLFQFILYLALVTIRCSSFFI